MQNERFSHADSLRITVATKRLYLRPLKFGDYETWFDAHVNGYPAQSKWDMKPYKPEKCSPEIYKKILRRFRLLEKKDQYYRFGAFEKESGMLVGHIDFDIYVRRTHQFANFGYQIYNRHWGEGFGQEAAAAGLRIGLKQLKLNRLEAAINLDNKKSIRLAKIIGMKREGIKKRYWYEHGKWTDHLIYVANPEDIGSRGAKPL